jgi:hypothetical protein
LDINEINHYSLEGEIEDLIKYEKKCTESKIITSYSLNKKTLNVFILNEDTLPNVGNLSGKPKT